MADSCLDVRAGGIRIHNGEAVEQAAAAEYPETMTWLFRTWKRVPGEKPHYKSGTLRMKLTPIPSGWRASFYCDRGSVPPMSRTGATPSAARRSVAALMKRVAKLVEGSE